MKNLDDELRRIERLEEQHMSHMRAFLYVFAGIFGLCILLAVVNRFLG